MTSKALLPITKIQCRMARGALEWSAEDLATHAHVSRSTVVRFERGLAVPMRAALEMIRQAFEAAGVVFLEDHGVSYREPAARSSIEGG